MPKMPRKKKTIAEYLKANLKPGTDSVKIGTPQSPETKKITAESMLQVMKIVAGIQYLVRGWIPFGMLTMILAPPGIGKSAFALYALVRVIIVGGLNWFSGTSGPRKPGFVLWCDTENCAAITVQRIKDWGLPPERIMVPFEDDPLRSINLNCPEDLERIEAVICRYEIKLVVVDSLRGSHGGDENSSKVSEVLKNLAAIAERTKSAVLVIHHTRKIHVDEEISADSSRGSNSITAMVRSQLGIDKPDKDSDWCRLQMLKENLGLKPTPIGFLIGSEGLEFGESPTKPRKTTQKLECTEWLRQRLTAGKWYSAKEIIEEGREAESFSEKTVRDAREGLGIVKPKYVRQVKGGWEWKLPSKK